MFEPNLRSVRTEAVEKVMAIFLDAHGLLGDPPAQTAPPPATEQNEDDSDSEDDLICDELLLQAFAK